MKPFIFLFLVISFSVFSQENEEPMGDTDSQNTQDGSLNTNTVGSVVSSNNNSKDESIYYCGEDLIVEILFESSTMCSQFVNELPGQSSALLSSVARSSNQ